MHLYLFFVLFLFSALACQTTTHTATHASDHATHIEIISADGVELVVTLSQGSSLDAALTFTGSSLASDVFSDSLSDGTWRLNVAASPSSANSVFYSSGHVSQISSVLAACVLVTSVNGQSTSTCSDAAVFDLSLPLGWVKDVEENNRVTVEFMGSMSYNFDMTIILTGETVSTFTYYDQTALYNALVAVYPDNAIFIVPNTKADVLGVLNIQVRILGFASESDAQAASDEITALNGGSFLSSPFDHAAATAGHVALGCDIGFEADTSGLCVDQDGCAENICGSQGTCNDIPAASSAEVYNCTCATGYVYLDGACLDCGSPASQTGYTIATGTTTIGSTRTVTCASGYGGTATALTCQSSGMWTASTGCIVQDGASAGGAGASCAAIKATTGTNTDGVFYISLPTVGAVQHYCIMNSAIQGGGWMLVLKVAATGNTFGYDASHWTTVTTLNPTDLTRNAGDAKYHGFNYFLGTSMLALWPDLSDGSSWYNFYQPNYNTYNGRSGAIAPIRFFSELGTTSYRINAGKSFSGWRSGTFTSQAGFQWYGYNYHGYSNVYVRWGFAFNNENDEASNDSTGGIGLGTRAAFSAGDKYWAAEEYRGLNRQMRAEIYLK